MYKKIVDGERLRAIFPDLSEELLKGKVEVRIKAYGDKNPKVEKVLERIERRIERGSYLGSESEVFFIDSEDLDEDARKILLQRVKEAGYEADLREGARDTFVLTLQWSNKE